jgi:hypothetical protein
MAQIYNYTYSHTTIFIIIIKNNEKFKKETMEEDDINRYEIESKNSVWL